MCNRFSKNLGLGDGSALPVGVPVPWPIATPPTGWLKCNGAAFTAAQYPKLALAYPALRLPDLRGEFIRGWDDGRGVDPGRILLSAQGDAIRNITGSITDIRFNVSAATSGVFANTTNGPASEDAAGGGSARNVSFDASRVVPTASENRPRNIAFNFIVRAA
ncbi:tail fiber protein [Salmonella enterica]|nr:tail fiber protein [Salmonella enterica]EMD3593473.1 tail fiber protein [Salmonella enterica]EMD3793245.1 tail fiber protein [Salmonella enterica]EMD4492576.1 tail fiber protein [Salmonella enterica]EMD5004917.1 tail fiber protein [Salmonella enterica]